MAKFQFMDYNDLTLFKNKLDAETSGLISNAISTAIKTVSISSDGLTIYFYRTASPASTDDATFSIPLPKPVDISGKVDKLTSATAGNLAAISVEGGIADSGKKATDFATSEQGANADYAKGKADKNEEEINKINNETTGILATAKKYTDSSISNLKITDYATISYVDGKLDQIYTKAEIDNLLSVITNNVTELSSYVGTIPPSAKASNIVAYIKEVADETKKVTTYDDTELRDRLGEAEDAIDVLNGDGDGSVSKQVADAVASIVADAPESYDTLKEISDWISSHASDASAMNSQINTNKEDIQSLRELVGKIPSTAKSKTIVAYIEEYVGGITGNIDFSIYAKQEDLDNAISRISANETDISNIKKSLATGGEISDAINQALDMAQNAQTSVDTLSDKVGNIPSGSQSTTIVDYIDEKTNGNSSKINTLEQRVGTNETNISTLTEKTDKNTASIDAINDPVSGIKAVAFSDATTKADNALKSAKEYTDNLANTTVANNTSSISKNASDINALEELVGEGYEAIPADKILALFN